MRFNILGPLRCSPPLGVDLLRRREGRILGGLLLAANRPVPTEQLIDLLWLRQPPPTARQQVQNCVAGLIRLFARVQAPLRVDRVGGGYLLRLSTQELDALAFEEEFTQAATAIQAGDHTGAARLLRAALGRWRGEVLLGLDMGPFQPAVVRLNELRLTATEQVFGVELGLGRHREVIADLAAAVAHQPAQENLVRHAMLALQAAGRQADALELFARTRRLLREELGVEPGPQLSAVHTGILTAAGPAGADHGGESLAEIVALAEVVSRRLDQALRTARRQPGRSGLRSSTG